LLALDKSDPTMGYQMHCVLYFWIYAAELRLMTEVDFVFSIAGAG